jgi:carbamoyl-phosphate synthase large subunit
MGNMNVLFTSIGRRNYMIPFFRESFSGKLFASNSIAQTSGMFEADQAFVSPPIKSSAYIPFLLDLCRTHQIQLIIPLFDMDLSVLSKEKAKFESIGTRIIVSDAETIEKCFDKLAYANLSNGKSILAPATFTNLQAATTAINNGTLRFPLIVKPRWGTGSIATSVVESQESLENTFNHLEAQLGESFLQDPVPTGQKNQMLIQEMAIGQEYGVDIVNDLKGEFFTAVVKRKLAMRAGETDMAEVVENELLTNVAKEISALTKHIGMLDADFIITNEGEVFLIDLNPRFGGGYPFSHLSGLNVPELYKKWLNNEQPSPADLTIAYGAVIAKGISLHKQK